MGSDIIIKNLNIKFLRKDGDIHAVKDVSVEFKAGQVTGIVGESGSGKSVLGMSILQLLPENAEVSGKITYSGMNILLKNEKQMREIRGNKIALIPQSPSESLNPSMKIGNQVSEIFRHHKRQSRHEALKSSECILEEFHLLDVPRCMSSYGFQLSGGMKQRVVSSFGIAANPHWVIADEPTKGMDRVLETQITEVLGEISKRTNMLIITHNLMLAQELCDRIIVMHNGCIIEKGDSNIFKNPLHPYTEGLVKSMPENGMVPMPFAQQKQNNNSCGICSWCHDKSDICTMEKPPLFKVAGRLVRCFQYAQSGKRL